jgi:hypothetical protein
MPAHKRTERMLHAGFIAWPSTSPNSTVPTHQRLYFTASPDKYFESSWSHYRQRNL